MRLEQHKPAVLYVMQEYPIIRVFSPIKSETMNEAVVLAQKWAEEWSRQEYGSNHFSQFNAILSLSMTPSFFPSNPNNVQPPAALWKEKDGIFLVSVYEAPVNHNHQHPKRACLHVFEKRTGYITTSVVLVASFRLDEEVRKTTTTLPPPSPEPIVASPLPQPQKERQYRSLVVQELENNSKFQNRRQQIKDDTDDE